MPVRPDPHGLLYFPAVPVSLPGQALNEYLTSQNLKELYRAVPKGDQRPIMLPETSRARG